MWLQLKILSNAVYYILVGSQTCNTHLQHIVIISLQNKFEF